MILENLSSGLLVFFATMSTPEDDRLCCFRCWHGVWGLGFKVWGLGFRGLGFRVWGLGFRVWGLGLGFRV